MRLPPLGLAFLGSLSCGLPPSATSDPVAAQAKLSPEAVSQVRAGDSMVVVVELGEPEGSDLFGLAGANGSPLTDDAIDRHADSLESLKTDVRRLAPTVADERTLRQLPLMVLRVSSEADLAQLASHASVKRIYANELHEASLAESLPLIHQPEAAAAGNIGEGVTVAVLDTGLDYRRAAFGNCTAPGTPSSCRVPYVQDFAAADGALDDNGHGTNVSGIVLGVAPGARVIGLDVFAGAGAYTSDILAAIDWCIKNRSTYNIVAINMSLGGGAASAPCSNDAFAAAITTAKAAGILSAVASGNNGYTSQLASPACAPDAISVGAVYDANVGGLSYSMCSDSVTAADRVTCFSNSASFLTVMAPGASITAAGITMSGTSQASPHVAGALAVLAAAYPTETVGLRLERLLSSPTSIVDPRNGVSKPRIDLRTAASGCAFAVSPLTTPTTASRSGETFTYTLATSANCAWTASVGDAWATVSATSGVGPATLTVVVGANNGAPRSTTLTFGTKTRTIAQAGDVTKPQGTVTISNGAAWTNTTAVTLGLSASDDGVVTSMCVTNATSCTTWVPFAATSAWVLAPGAGVKTVRAFFKDAANNVSVAALDTISLEVVAPINGKVTATGGDGQVALIWSGFSDAASGVASYKVVVAPTTAPSSCAVGTVVYTGTETSVVHAPVTNGLTLGYRVCAIDVAGNVSAGTIATARTAPEFDAPAGVVTINSGASWTKSLATQLSFNVTDASAVTQMCVSNTATCTAWVSYTSTLPWTLLNGAGPRTVWVRFRDEWGNVSSAVSDSILYDAALPVGGKVVASPGDAQVSLSWSGFTDALSGVAAYKVVMAAGAAPANCSQGTLVANGLSATAFVQTGLTNGTTYGFRVCAVDLAGNVSGGAIVVSMPAPEFAGPTGSFTIAGGAAFTNVLSVPLVFDVSDASGVASMCVSNTSTCTKWVPFTSSLTWALASGAGAKTVFASFKDPWGNVSSVLRSSITVDLAAPTQGSLTATAGAGQVALSWSGFADLLSGIASYTLVYAAGTTAPASCSAGTVLMAGAATTFTHTDLAAGKPVTYRLCATDAVGNRSLGVVRTATPTP